MVEVRSNGQSTTVVLQQPLSVLQPKQGYFLTRGWSSGICSCFDDCESSFQMRPVGFLYLELVFFLYVLNIESNTT
ncbi:unnamed protein product [Schistosoma mattheei]|uniref:Uncharacterized protein n=1 Tax=Schistosoma mattheei TaxID=31246 RepID=A0AA85AZN3_9TREM|nr:unnamed protein product [Schistosoma mattheei]